jgi:hypothetical protein
MANEFKIKKGLIVTGASGGTVVDIQGSQGQLFSVTDDLSGSIFAVSDISGVPILDVNSSGLSTFDGSVGIGLTSTTANLEVKSIQDSSFDEGIGVVRSNTSQTGYINMVGGAMNINAPNAIPIKFRDGGNTNLTIGGDGHATFAGNVSGVAGTFTGNLAVGNASAAEIYLNRNSANYINASNAAGYLVFRTGGSTTALTLNATGAGTFATQAFATTATSSGDASSTLTTKGYVDGLITGATIYRGAWDPSGGGYGSPDLSGVTQTSGYYYICSAAGTAEPNGTGCEPDSWETGDWVIWNDDIVDCAGTGTGGWQKIDNSSVLSGVGTGQTVALWEGASSVTDSETLGNAPITVSGNNATFAGAISTTYVTSGGFTDGFVTWNAAQFNRAGAAIEFQYAGSTNSFVKIGAGGSNPTTFNANTGDATFAGDVTADNITSTSNGGSASIYINSSRPTLGFTDSNSFTDPNDIYIVRGTGGNKLAFQWHDNSAATTTETFNINNSGNATFSGTLSSVGYSGTSGTFSTSVTAAGNSNSFGNTSIAALSATSGTFSLSVTAAGNSNSFGATTVTSNLTTNGVLTIQNAAPYIQWKNVAGTRLSYIQHNATNLVMSADTGQIQLDTAADNDILINPGGTGKVGIGTTTPSYKLAVSGGIQAGGKVTYTKQAGSLDTTGYDVAGLTTSTNGQSAGFTFTCFGHSGGYQKIVYSCYNGAGNWYANKVIDEGTNQLDVVASANSTTITFTFKSISGTMSYTPRVTVEAVGTAINSTYA